MKIKFAKFDPDYFKGSKQSILARKNTRPIWIWKTLGQSEAVLAANILAPPPLWLLPSDPTPTDPFSDHDDDDHSDNDEKLTKLQREERFT